MFRGYDPDRRPPYKQVVYQTINNICYKITYLVSNGYGGSISISSSMVVSEENYEKSSNGKQS